MNLAAFVQQSLMTHWGRHLAMGTVTGTDSNRIEVTIPTIGAVTCPWLRTAGQDDTTTLEAEVDDEVIVIGVGEPPTYVVLGIVER